MKRKSIIKFIKVVFGVIFVFGIISFITNYFLLEENKVEEDEDFDDFYEDDDFDFEYDDQS